MKIEKIVVVPKLSKYELDMHLLNLASDKIIDRYKKEGVDIDRILSSHERQKQELNKLKQLLPNALFISRDEFTNDIATRADLVIAFGGDNHFQYVSHFINDKLILGINSDPVSSEGALTYFTVDSFSNELNNIKAGKYNIEEWTRLGVYFNGNYVGLATSEVFIGEKERKNMSRHILEFGKKKEEQKCSGLIVATGTGATGWYDSSCRYLYENGNKFSKIESSGRFLITEPYNGKHSNYSMLEGKLNINEELLIHSLNDSSGIVTLDCIEEYKFNRGAHVKVKIGVSLKVIRP